MSGDRGDSEGASVNTQLKEAKYANMENFNCILIVQFYRHYHHLVFSRTLIFCQAVLCMLFTPPLIMI